MLPTFHFKHKHEKAGAELTHWFLIFLASLNLHPHLTSTSSCDMSKAAATEADPTCVPAGVDLKTFFAPSLIPDEVRASVPLMHQYSIDKLKLLIERVFVYVKSSKQEQRDVYRITQHHTTPHHHNTSPQHITPHHAASHRITPHHLNTYQSRGERARVP